jgi:hypothetical protein
MSSASKRLKDTIQMLVFASFCKRHPESEWDEKHSIAGLKKYATQFKSVLLLSV